MKAYELMEELFALAPDGDYTDTCDTLKAGSPEREVSRVAVTMIPTVDVIRQAASWGADLLIVHEPMYYNHADHHSTESVECEKRALVEQTGMTIYRYHDHPHRAPKDMIALGEYALLGLDGEIDWSKQFGLTRVRLHQPMTPRELAMRMEERLGIGHVRICGAADAPCTRIASLFGAPGNGVGEALKREDVEIVLTGEACEWAHGEYARDAAQLGRKKALLIMGHVGSERDGMSELAKQLEKKHPELAIRYFDCGEVYTYAQDAAAKA